MRDPLCACLSEGLLVWPTLVFDTSPYYIFAVPCSTTIYRKQHPVARAQNNMAPKAASTMSTEKHRFTTTHLTKHAACKATFDTTELVESILSFLPAINIFGVIRVSKGVKSVIDGSPALQERMFLRLRPRLAQAPSSNGEL